MEQKNMLKKWVQALRSGEYKQGKGALRVNDRFCCLGVACDIFGATWWHDGDSLDDRYEARIGRSRSNKTLMPDNLVKKLGLTDSVRGILIEMNDGGSRFKTIATFIEDTLINKNI